MKTDRITISHIARELNISSVSVSRALSGKDGVSDDLRVQILEKAREMGYTKSQISLSPRILVLHREPYKKDNSNFSLMVQGMEKALRKVEADYHFEFIDQNSQLRSILPYKLSKGAKFDGVVMLGRFRLDYASFIHGKIPNLIFYTGYSPAYDYDSVWFSFIHSGYRQTEYLLEKGHRDIGFLGNFTFYRNKERLVGITSALEEREIPVNHDFFVDTGKQYPERLEEMILQKKLPSAFICDFDFTAIELIQLLYSHKINVPQDISVMGSGNTDMAPLSIPALTSLDLHIEYACEVAIATLMKRISRPDKPSENIAVLSTIVERDSVRSLL